MHYYFKYEPNAIKVDVGLPKIVATHCWPKLLIRFSWKFYILFLILYIFNKQSFLLNFWSQQNRILVEKFLKDSLTSRDTASCITSNSITYARRQHCNADAFRASLTSDEKCQCKWHSVTYNTVFVEVYALQRLLFSNSNPEQKQLRKVLIFPNSLDIHIHMLHT